MLAIGLRIAHALLFITSVIWAVVYWRSGGSVGLGVIICLLPTFVVYLCIATSMFAQAYWHERQAPLADCSPLSLKRRLRLVLGETWRLLQLYSVWMAFPGQPVQRRGSGVPIILVHGYACNHGVWRCVLQALVDSSLRPLYTVELRPSLRSASMDDYAAQLARTVAIALEGSQASQVDLVGHSMGGLVVRAYSVEHGDQVRRLVTVGTPNHGTRLANVPFVGMEQVRQMRYHDNSWTIALEQRSQASDVAKLSMWSPHEEIVVPAVSARLKGEDERQFVGYGHMELVTHPVPVAFLVQHLLQDDTAMLRSQW